VAHRAAPVVRRSPDRARQRQGNTNDLPDCAGAARVRPMKALALQEEQFVTDAHGTRIGVVLDLRTYLRLREAEEQLADVRAYDRTQPRVRREVAAGQCVSLREYRARRGRKRA